LEKKYLEGSIGLKKWFAGPNIFSAAGHPP